jgi:hypothetical protein
MDDRSEKSATWQRSPDNQRLKWQQNRQQTGNILLLFLSRHSEATADRHSPPQKLYKKSHLIRAWQDMDDRSGKPATSVTSLIINDLACNICRNKPATSPLR